MKTERSASISADTSSGALATASDVSIRRTLLAFGGIVACLCFAFIVPLIQFVQLAFSKDRFSYLLLVPFVTAYLIWIKRKEINPTFGRSFGAAVAPAVIGIGALCVAFSGNPVWSVDPTNRLSLEIFGLLNLLLGAAFISLGTALIRQIIFPVSFLFFATPMPEPFADIIEVFLQYASADAAYWMLSLTPVPLIRDGLAFQMPGLSIRVAQECSGYNSSFALFMVSTIASYLFLRSLWKRIALPVIVIPLAIARNGFRITTLSLLSVYDDPEWINSPLHHRGGPIFFALSLIPFFLLLWGLRKSESLKDRKKL